MRKEGVMGLLKILKPALVLLGILLLLKAAWAILGGDIMMTIVLAVVVVVLMLAQYSHWKVKQEIMEAAKSGYPVDDLTERQKEHLEGLGKMQTHFVNWTLRREYFWTSVIRFAIIGVCFYYM